MAAEETENGDAASTTRGFENTTRLLGGAVAIVISAAGTFGTASGGLAFLLRNQPFYLSLALVLAALSAGAATWAALWLAKGQRTRANRRWMQIRWLVVSAILIAGAFAMIVATQAQLARDPARPVITAEFANSSTGASLKVAVEADALSTDDQLLISVTGGNGSTFYWGATGADRSGHARQSATIPVPLGLADALVVSSSVVKRRDLRDVDPTDVVVGCDGSLHAVSRSMPPRRLNHPACVVIKAIPTSTSPG